jgi:hypothetical protein
MVWSFKPINSMLSCVSGMSGFFLELGSGWTWGWGDFGIGCGVLVVVSSRDSSFDVWTFSCCSSLAAKSIPSSSVFTFSLSCLSSNPFWSRSLNGTPSKNLMYIKGLNNYQNMKICQWYSTVPPSAFISQSIYSTYFLVCAYSKIW